MYCLSGHVKPMNCYLQKKHYASLRLDHAPLYRKEAKQKRSLQKSPHTKDVAKKPHEKPERTWSLNNITIGPNGLTESQSKPPQRILFREIACATFRFAAEVLQECTQRIVDYAKQCSAGKPFVRSFYGESFFQKGGGEKWKNLLFFWRLFSEWFLPGAPSRALR